jgi:hypothetical protein
MSRDQHMIGPGMHEAAAERAEAEQRPESARIQAMLATASAINRLADAAEVLANVAVAVAPVSTSRRR